MSHGAFKLMGWRVRVEDLHHMELLELDPEGGVVRFDGQRALVLDAVAMGILRGQPTHHRSSPPKGSAGRAER